MDTPFIAPESSSTIKARNRFGHANLKGPITSGYDHMFVLAIRHVPHTARRLCQDLQMGDAAVL